MCTYPRGGATIFTCATPSICRRARFWPHTRAPKTICSPRSATRTGIILNPRVLTLGFARRAATYKRADLMFTNPERLQQIAERAGGLQILYAGKAHPQDEPGKALVHHVVEEAVASLQ